MNLPINKIMKKKNTEEENRISTTAQRKYEKQGINFHIQLACGEVYVCFIYLFTNYFHKVPEVDLKGSFCSGW